MHVYVQLNYYVKNAVVMVKTREGPYDFKPKV